MNSKIIFLIVLGLLAAFIVGCGTAASPTPLPTVAPQVITVVITATLPPPTATSAAPTVTPMPTLPLTSTVATATPATQAVVKPTTVARAAATRTPTKPAVTPTATSLPMKFGAPVLNKPLWTDSQKDQVTFMGGAIVLEWQSAGGLPGDECYLVRIQTEPVNPGPGVGVAADYWVAYCGDQTGAGFPVKFILESPNRVGSAPNYGSLLLNTDQMWATWTITVVKNLGQCDPSYQYHCKTAPISPAGKGRFLFKGG